MKHCPDCKIDKYESEFSKDQSRRDGLTSRCTLCNRKRAYKYKYGIPKERLCLICKKEKPDNEYYGKGTVCARCRGVYKSAGYKVCPCDNRNYKWRREHPCTH